MSLTLKNLSFRYDERPVLNHLNLSLDKQSFVSILGPSGGGKSTILKIIAGILPIQEGTIDVQGEAVNGIHKQIAYMPQEDLLLEWETVFQNVTLYQRIHKLAIDKKAVYEKIKRFGLKGYENSYPYQLSGGMRQRVAFLRTALCEAEIMLLDEPFGSLDVISRQEMQDWLQSIRFEMNQTILLVSHDLDEALYLSDRIVVLKQGQVGETFEISEPLRTRTWLYQQHVLREKLHQALSGGVDRD